MKPKQFKKQKDLIEQAVAKAIHKNDVEKPKRVQTVKEKIEHKLKEKNWLAWAQRQLTK
jgi:hypothetical protein